MFLNSLYRTGKSIDVKIDKRLHVLNAQESWFGFACANHQGDILDAEQFELVHTSNSNTRNEKTEYFAVEFRSNGKSIRIADEIEGKKGALAVLEAIADLNFN